jgi:hypothetical protein
MDLEIKGALSQKHTFSIRSFFKSKERPSYYRKIGTAATGEGSSLEGEMNRLRMNGDFLGKVLELNLGCPSGWYYQGALMNSFWRSFAMFAKKGKTIPRYQCFSNLHNILQEARSIKEGATAEHGLSRFAHNIIQSAIDGHRKVILLTAADPALIASSQEEDPNLFEEIKKQIAERGLTEVRVEMRTVEDVWEHLIQPQKNSVAPFNPNEYVMFADCTPEEIQELFLDSGRMNKEDFGECMRIFNTIPTFGPFALEGLTGRSFYANMDFSEHDSPLFAPAIPGSAVYVRSESGQKKLFANGHEINIDEYVIKAEGTFGGGGVSFCGHPNHTLKRIEELKASDVSFTLEHFLTGTLTPKSLQPVMITPRNTAEPGYAARASEFVGEFTVDTRLVGLVHPPQNAGEEPRVEIISMLGRYNYPNRPDNVGSGGGVVPLVVVKDQEYQGVLNGIEDFLDHISEGPLREWYDDMQNNLLEQGFGYKGVLQTFGLLPHVITETAFNHMVAAYKDAGRRLVIAAQKNGTPLTNPALLAIDMYINPNPSTHAVERTKEFVYSTL